jgi:predicted Fe-Mo cluster-binding NifX family protein
MKIVVTATGSNLDAPASPVFGRCPNYLFVDSETMAFEAVENPAMSAAGGAGIQAAQFVVARGAQAVLTGNVGPNAADVLKAAGVPVYQIAEGTVRQVVTMFEQGQLSELKGANVAAHAGMGRGAGRGMGRGRLAQSAPPSPSPAASTPPPASRQEELANLRQTASDLRRQLAEVMDRLEKLKRD